MRGQEIIRKAITNSCGFLTVEQVKAIAEDQDTRLQSILVRTHQGRFTAPAQDVLGLVAAVVMAGYDLRDFSLPATCTLK